MPRFVFAVESLSFGSGAEMFQVRKGDVYESSHPAVLANPAAFSDVPPDGFYHRGPAVSEPVVEQATAGPGEKRATRRG